MPAPGPRRFLIRNLPSRPRAQVLFRPGALPMPFAFSSSSGWRHSLSRCGAGDTVLDALEAARSTRSDPVLPGRITRAENPPVTVLTPDGTVRAGLGAVPRPVAGDWVLVGVADPV